MYLADQAQSAIGIRTHGIDGRFDQTAQPFGTAVRPARRASPVRGELSHPLRHSYRSLVLRSRAKDVMPRSPVTSITSPRLWALPAALLLAMLSLQGLGLVGALRYERSAVAAGQWWRLFGAHLVHLGWHHLLMNALALLLLWILFGPLRSGRQWLLVVLATMFGITAGLYLLDPGLGWYVGFSGVLHGIFAAGVVGQWRRQRALSLVMTVALLAKLGWEQMSGGAAATAAFVGGAVVVDAHLYGAVSGAVAALVLALGRVAGPKGREGGQGGKVL